MRTPPWMFPDHSWRWSLVDDQHIWPDPGVRMAIFAYGHAMSIQSIEDHSRTLVDLVVDDAHGWVPDRIVMMRTRRHYGGSVTRWDRTLVRMDGERLRLPEGPPSWWDIQGRCGGLARPILRGGPSIRVPEIMQAVQAHWPSSDRIAPHPHRSSLVGGCQASPRESSKWRPMVTSGRSAILLA